LSPAARTGQRPAGRPGRWHGGVYPRSGTSPPPPCCHYRILPGVGWPRRDSQPGQACARPTRRGRPSRLKRSGPAAPRNRDRPPPCDQPGHAQWDQPGHAPVRPTRPRPVGPTRPRPRATNQATPSGTNQATPPCEQPGRAPVRPTRPRPVGPGPAKPAGPAWAASAGSPARSPGGSAAADGLGFWRFGRPRRDAISYAAET
jgi:hypothetical protein